MPIAFNTPATSQVLLHIAGQVHGAVFFEPEQLPELAGKLDGFSMRVPTINVSVVDFVFTAARETSKDEIDQLVQRAAGGDLNGVLAYSDGPLVSVDFNHNPASSIYDATLTRLIDKKLVKVCAWYDNEWGFSNRMLDTTLVLAGLT